MTLLTCFVLLAGQAISMQRKAVVHLKPNTSYVQPDFRGKVLELLNAPALIELPTPPPKPAADGSDWTVDIKNLGPNPVTIMDSRQFKIPLSVGQTLHIDSNGATYRLIR